MSQTSVSNNDHSSGWMLVAAQFVLIGLLILIAFRAPMPGLVRGLIGAMVVLDGLALFVLTMVFNRIGNWAVHPVPKQNAALVTAGPYRVIRHPMYAAVLLVALGVILWSASPWSVLATGLLCAVLAGKMQIEERLMQGRFGQEYQTYLTQTRRVIPGIW